MSLQKQKKRGRPFKHGEPMVPVNYRVPVSKKKEADQLIAEKKQEWQIFTPAQSDCTTTNK